MATTQEYLSLQGSSHLAKNVDGRATVLRELGNQVSVNLKIETDSFAIKETKTGVRAEVMQITKERTVSLEMKFDEQKKDDIALAFGADSVSFNGKQTTDEPISTLKNGDEIKLNGFNLSDLTVTDNQGQTLAVDSNYTADLKMGVFKLIDIASFEQPLKATYTEGNVTASVLFTLPDGVDYYYLFKGINTIDNKHIALELWRFKPTVNTDMAFINEEIGELTISGKALADATRQKDPKLGAFGRIVYLD